jgi:hypothetical protein
MAAVGRVQLTRVPARETEAVPKKLRDDTDLRPARARQREFGDDLEDETTKKFQKPAQVPTAEQLALAGMIVPQPVKPEAVMQPIELDFAQIQQTAAIAAPKLALVASADMLSDIDHDRSACGKSEELPATPLEQAVIDLLDKHEAMPDLVAGTGVGKAEIQRDVPTPRIAQAAPIAPLRELPEMAAPTSHVNLIMDDGDRRIVVTVAVRGNDVNVHMRGGDDVAAGLARNAGSLDEAMRARGLSLAEFTANRDSDQADSRDRPQYERRESAKEVFTLEETV